MMPRILGMALLAGLLLTAGCAKAPTAEIQAADEALQKASVAEAADYAPEALQAAREARDKLDIELKAQEGRSALFRSYDEAKSLAEQAEQAAVRAESQAAEGRSRAREEAAALIARVHTSLDEVKNLLQNAPRGKGSAADLAMLKSDVGGIEQSLTEMESAFAAERYMESKAKAQAALDSAGQVQAQIEQAMNASRKPPQRRG